MEAGGAFQGAPDPAVAAFCENAEQHSTTVEHQRVMQPTAAIVWRPCRRCTVTVLSCLPAGVIARLQQYSCLAYSSEIP
jgi:hypothetical protein